MKIARTTKTPSCRALAVACCFALLPVLVCAQTTDDKNKKKAAPAPAQQQPARPAQQAPAQQPPPRQVQQAPAQQQPPRQVQQQPPAQQTPPRQVQQAPFGGQNPQAPNNGGQQPRGIAGQNPQAPNNGGQQPRGIAGQNPQAPNNGGQQPRGIAGQNPQAPNNGGQQPRGIAGQNPQAPNNGGQQPRGIAGQNPQIPNNPGQQPRGIAGQNPQAPNNGGQQPRGIAGQNPQAPNTGGMERRPAPSYHPPAGVQTSRQPNGSQIHVDPRTRTTVHTDPGGHITTLERPGLTARGFRPDGGAAHIEHSGPDGSRMVVDRGLHGERRVEVVRPGGVRVVAVGRQSFVERPMARRGYVSRTYVVGGRTEVRVYRSYSYRSVSYVTYVPRVYYQPAFYGWAARPWGPTVAYSWGWAPATPWFYGGYFAPAPVYDTPALWLTDFLLAANLQAAYDNRQQYQDQQQGQPPQMAQSNGVMLTPEIKAQIAEEVKQQLEVDRLTASQAATAPPAQASGVDVPPPALKQRVFVVSTSFDVTAIGSGESCGLSAGDIIERTPGQPITSDGKVPVDVMSSKAGDCPAEFLTRIDVATLQDMQNDFKNQIASGMATLASNSGKGLPTGPAANPRPSADGQAPPNPTNDAQSRDLVAKLNVEADQTEADIRQTANGNRQ